MRIRGILFDYRRESIRWSAAETLNYISQCIYFFTAANGLRSPAPLGLLSGHDLRIDNRQINLSPYEHELTPFRSKLRNDSKSVCPARRMHSLYQLIDWNHWKILGMSPLNPGLFLPFASLNTSRLSFAEMNTMDTVLFTYDNN